jgi:SAM-dependent methyltransferase
MIYQGFATRDYLVLNCLKFEKSSSLLEIGVGTGSTAERIISRVRRFCGIDISVPLVDYLAQRYRHEKSVSILAHNVCNGVSLNEKFDIIYSLDTLEHVTSPSNYFEFISVHLADEGLAFVTYPNESEEEHHGITWFGTKTELFEVIDSSGLSVHGFYEIKSSLWHRIVERFLWRLPRSIMSGSSSLPQTFEQTRSFEIMSSSGFRSNIFSCYARLVSRIAVLLPPFKFMPCPENISNRRLLMYLRRK